MDCARITDELVMDKYLVGNLSDAEREAFEQHFFECELNDVGTVSHVRMSIYPDGGVSRLRLHGQIDPEA